MVSFWNRWIDLSDAAKLIGETGVCLRERIRYPSPSPERSPPHHRRKDRSRSPLFRRHSRLRNRVESVNEKRAQRARRFGIEQLDKELVISEDEVEDLYRSMDVDGSSYEYRLNTVYVRGVDGLTIYQIEKIFAEFAPSAVEMIDSTCCNVFWSGPDARYIVAKMLLEMTKPLKRIRSKRVAEDGEVAEESEEEEGEMKEEQGDDVTINRETDRKEGNVETCRSTASCIEVDVGKVNVPPGKWRIITKHVGNRRLLIVRFSQKEDIRAGRTSLAGVRQTANTDTVDRDGFSYKWTNKRDRVRPGLNVFDEKGEELDWDYEHDTRFYEDSNTSKEQPSEDGSTKPSNDGGPEEFLLGERKVRSRGRGTKKLKTFLNSDVGCSLAADEEETKLKAKHVPEVSEPNWRATDDDDDCDLSDDRDPSPTPQPWDAKRSSVHLRTSFGGRPSRRFNE
ncbi:hypothetical protein AB6A40_007668 [Gnathostoma spinigerum]|uniref:Nuclear cap-binding protein subunit 3 n=1 Tax=Gnathostoma spinigerum TaxID=75299 RepID=A0ABD6EUK3_9BILA